MKTSSVATIKNFANRINPIHQSEITFLLTKFQTFRRISGFPRGDLKPETRILVR